MKIELKNIGKIRTASVDLDGITVIAGENNTGKSTVSRALYSTYKTLYNASGQIHLERVATIRNNLVVIYRSLFSGINLRINVTSLSNYILDHLDEYKDSPDNLRKIIMEAMERVEDKKRNAVRYDDIEAALSIIHSALNMEETEILAGLADKVLDVEFHSQINNIYHESQGTILLFADSTPSVFTYEQQHLINLENPNELPAGIIYLDDPFILDNLSVIGWQLVPGQTHRYDLQQALTQPPSNSVISEILVDKQLSEIHGKIDAVCPGEIVDIGNQDFRYRQPGSDKLLDVCNLSTGLKTFVILKTLLRNGTLEAGSTVILDEPEIHLHPEWQLIFAELIVLLRQKFHLHILLTTHSPYFLEAIEVYSAKYGIKDDCKYYLSHNEGEFSDITDVSEDIEQIYKLLAKPFQILEDARY